MHPLTFLILLISVFIGVSAGFDVWRDLRQAEVHPTPRMQALICWHEFQSGRRATTADCPEL